jgi:hypothetical protein
MVFGLWLLVFGFGFSLTSSLSQPTKAKTKGESPKTKDQVGYPTKT